MLTQNAFGLRVDLERSGKREFARDLADLVSDDDEQQIRKRSDQLLTDHTTPLIVLTIKSMASHGGADLRIDTFARILFDQWEIGHAQLGDQSWNTGILLLVSKGDRKARIELGAGWKLEKNALCERIMRE